MDRTAVTSSNVASIGYEKESMQLEVEFLNGSIYQYFNVPGHIYAELMSAASHGRYLDANIKKAGYHCERVN